MTAITHTYSIYTSKQLGGLVVERLSNNGFQMRAVIKKDAPAVIYSAGAGKPLRPTSYGKKGAAWAAELLATAKAALADPVA